MYVLQWTNPALPGKTTPINVPVGSIVSNAASLRFTGKGAANYGGVQQENLMYLLENFANGTAPTLPTTGQTWYDTNQSILKVCTGTSPVTWKSLAGVQVTGVGDPAPTPAALGDLWFQRTGSSSGVLRVYTGLGRFPNTSNTIGGWDQVWPTVEVAAGREEYDSMLALVNQLIGDPVTYGGSGASGKDVTLQDLTPLDAALRTTFNARTPLDANVLVPTTDSQTELLVSPTSQDWDLLLAAAKYALNRLELPSGYVNNISSVPFVSDGLPTPASLISLGVGDPRYPTLERRSNRRFGMVTLVRTFQETANALTTAVANRYSMKGINGATGSNPSFNTGVTTSTYTTLSGAAASNTGGSATLQIPFASAANLTSFLASGGAIQLRMALSGGSTTGDTNLAALFAQRGVVRLTADKARIFANVLPYSQSAAPASSSTFNPSTTQTIAGASFTVSLAVSGSNLVVTLQFTSTGAMQGTVSIGFDVIRDTSTYGSTSATLYPAPTAYATGYFTAKSSWLNVS